MLIFDAFFLSTDSFNNFLKLNINTAELELRVGNSWITNQCFDPTNQKFVKLPFFMNCFFPKYYNFKTISTDDICISLAKVKLVRLNDERTKFCKSWGYTLKLKTVKKFFTKQYFFLNFNPALKQLGDKKNKQTISMSKNGKSYFAKNEFAFEALTVLCYWAPTPQNGKTHSNNSSATADELFESVWPFCKVSD